MRAVKYGVRLDRNRHPYLMEECSAERPWAFANSPERIAELVNEGFGLNRMAEECLYLVGLSQTCEVLGVFEVSHGTATASLSHAREIFLRAVLCGAVSIALVHNHPSGSVLPSETDIGTYKELKEAGELMKIPLTDFLIVGNGLYSFRRDHKG